MSRASDLIRELFHSPKLFASRGKSYQLLQEYFGGHSLQTILPLIASDSVEVRRVAVFIVSELGSAATPLLQEVLKLENDEDRYINYHFLEIIMVCGDGNFASAFVHVVKSLVSDDEIIRGLAMRLVFNASLTQLEGAYEECNRQPVKNIEHLNGLSVLLNGENIEVKQIIELLIDPTPLAKKYGAIAARKNTNHLSSVLSTLSQLEDADIVNFLGGSV